MSNNKTLFVGIDDGYLETKLYLQDGTTARIPSQAKAGEMNQISINGSETTVFPYSTSEGKYIIGDLRESDSTSFDEYPMSALNRVIVAHALRRAGVPGNFELCVCTGLPVKKFYMAGAMNKKLVKQKIANLLKNDVKAMDGASIPKIVKHEVVSEGIATWMDIVMVRGENGKLTMDREQAAKRMAIVDVGGRTTDIAVIEKGNLDTSRSSTINVGMLAIREAVAEALTEKYGITPSVDQMNEFVDHKRIKLFGKYEYAEDIFAVSAKSTVARIQSEVKRCLGSAADIDGVVFAGGTIEQIRPYIEGWFPHQIVAEDPAFANARGMQKYAEYVMSRS